MRDQTLVKDFIPIDIQTLSSKRLPPQDYYLIRDRDSSPVLFRSQSLPLAPQDLIRLRESGIQTLWVRSDAYQESRGYPTDRMETLILDPSVPLETKCETVYNAAGEIMEAVFLSSEPERIIETSEKVLNPFVELIFGDRKAAHNFILQTSRDYALYTHSINVCLYGLSLARRVLGISKQDAMRRFGPGLLLHDLGMMSIREEIEQKIDPLTREDWDMVRQHPFKGLEMVQEHLSISSEYESIILHHHERLDGSGYPLGLRGREISIAARICALVDTFDAINTNRPYRKRKPSFEALQTVKSDLPHRLDETLYREFVYLFLPPK